MRYIPHTQLDIEYLLKIVGKESLDQLFEVIPPAQQLQGELVLPPAKSEAELLDHFDELGARNQPQSHRSGRLSFCGAGCYHHVIPKAVDHLCSRSEFYTAYTPYQPELSQGTLLSIFEYQTLIAELYDMEVSNASMYDGASATAEAILMAQRLTHRKRVLAASSVHPEYRQTCVTYLSGMYETEVMETIPFTKNGSIDLEALKKTIDDSVAAVIVQTPNFFGVLEDLSPICQAAHDQGALAIVVSTEPLAMALLAPPGSAGADIVVGEGIGLSGPTNMGGPGLGIFATRGKKAIRAMPGRIVGQTEDSKGRIGYVLTLATREQHIRRERATSNICTNHGLMALRFTIHLALLGKTGFEELARMNFSKAVFARDRICEVDGFEPRFATPFFNELAIRVPRGDADAFVSSAIKEGVVPGVALGRYYPELEDTLLVAVNETHRRQDLERLAKCMHVYSSP